MEEWGGPREHVVKSALCCWVPIEDLHAFLNRMSGPRLTLVDVAQRLRAFEDDEHFSYPNEDLRAGCLALYEKEKAEGTELPAVLGLLRDHVEREEERIRAEQQARYQQWRAEDRMVREQRLLSGADCGWTQLPKSKHWYCRTNGRTYRLSPTPDKMWTLHRLSTVSEGDKGTVIGKYRQRGDATKVVRETAYQAEPRW